MAGKLASITDSAGNSWKYGYDGLGDRISVTDPDRRASTSSYDDAGQLISVTDARGKTISWTYDKDGRDTAEYDTTGGALESASTEIASWTWDTLAKGKLTSSVSYWGGAACTEETTGYDSYGLPSGTETIIPAGQGKLAGTCTTTCTYAPDGTRLSCTDPAAWGTPCRDRHDRIRQCREPRFTGRHQLLRPRAVLHQPGPAAPVHPPEAPPTRSGSPIRGTRRPGTSPGRRSRTAPPAPSQTTCTTPTTRRG